MNLSKKPNILVRGQIVRLPNWNECAMVIDDVGEYSVWGKVLVLKTKRIVDEAAFPIDANWMPLIILGEGMKN